MEMDVPSGWPLYHKFEEEIKSRNRFFPDEKILKLLRMLAENEDNQHFLPEGTCLYRARRNEPEGDFKYVSELGANKTNPANNRASPAGIPYMYLADNAKTAIAEVRANVNEYATVATFKTNEPLKLFILDSAGFYAGKIDDAFDSMAVAGFILYLSRAFAAPVQKQAEIEYLPTQYFAEYCKSQNYAGLRYVSSARGFHGITGKNYYNYVLFDDTKVSYQEAYKYKVSDIKYEITNKGKVLLKDEGEK